MLSNFFENTYSTRENWVDATLHRSHSHSLTRRIYVHAEVSHDQENSSHRLFFYLILVSFEYFIRLIFMSHKKDITMPRKVIRKGNEVAIAISGTYGSAYISMYQTQDCWETVYLRKRRGGLPGCNLKLFQITSID